MDPRGAWGALSRHWQQRFVRDGQTASVHWTPPPSRITLGNLTPQGTLLRHRHAARALTLWIVLAWSWGCSSYQRTAPSALLPGGQKVSVTLRQPRRMMEQSGANSSANVAGVIGRLERVSGDTLYVSVDGGWTDGGRPVRLAPAATPLAIAVADTEKIDAYRYSGRLTTLAVVGGLVLTWVIVMASACIMCSSGDSGGSTWY